MEIEFCVQDPTDPGTRYLYEAIIAAAAEASAWQGIYAFATRGGVDKLIEDPVFHDFMRRGGEIDLVVGMDAITNQQALERMQELAARHRTFRPRVFWNEERGLFHPKISRFTYPNGRKKLIVGSGNLTPGGLMHNFEGYTVIAAGRRETLDISSLDAFLTRHADDIRPIDQEALDRCALNVGRPAAVEPRVRVPTPRPRVARPAVAVALNRVLVAQVPAAGGRWSQVHFSGDIIEQYFRVTDVHVQRVYLTWIHADGTRGEEEVRPVIYSEVNKNHKIEIGAAKGKDYPAYGPPILLFRERQVRCFDYMLLVPADAAYAAVRKLSDELPTIGRGFRRAITNTATLAQAWPTCPLLTATAEVGLDI